MPLGFKNATNGDPEVAINAIQAASQPQTFLHRQRWASEGLQRQPKLPYCFTRDPMAPITRLFM